MKKNIYVTPEIEVTMFRVAEKILEGPGDGDLGYENGNEEGTSIPETTIPWD